MPVNGHPPVFVLAMSLFASTAFAGNNPAPTQVVVSNTSAQRVPVKTQAKQYYQPMQTPPNYVDLPQTDRYL